MNIIKSLMSKSSQAERSFGKIASEFSAPMLELVQCTIDCQTNLSAIDLALLDQLHLESSQVEEFLDAANANNNQYWYLYRRAVAFIKTFSRVVRKILYIRDSYQHYQLISIDAGFLKETEDILNQSRELLIDGCQYCIKEANKHHLHLASMLTAPKKTTHLNSPLQLPSTRQVRHEAQPSITVISLATEFLQLVARQDIFSLYQDKDHYKNLSALIPNDLSVEQLRLLAVRFHNMQSSYDTFISGSDLLRQDHKLTIMSHHINLAYALIEIATLTVHYYQRHVHQRVKTSFLASFTRLDANKILNHIVFYSLHYADILRMAGRGLCQDMLKHYTEPGVIETLAPFYRGFHVRPSTLIAKIVAHYGSQVVMKIDQTSYDAGLPLDLFRANEELNARKRKHVFEVIGNSEILKNYAEVSPTLDQRKHAIREFLMDLVDKKQIALYDTNLSFSDMVELDNETYLEFFKRLISRYMAMGRLDVRMEIKIIFEGDKRVLEDIQALADHGYGEDLFGNNIVLPTKLNYLRQ